MISGGVPSPQLTQLQSNAGQTHHLQHLLLVRSTVVEPAYHSVPEVAVVVGGELAGDDGGGWPDDDNRNGRWPSEKERRWVWYGGWPDVLLGRGWWS